MLMDKIKAGVDISFGQGFKFRTGVLGTRQECSSEVRRINLEISTGDQIRKQGITFIPHMIGGINFHEALGTEDVMSGIFTGCVMATYKVGDKRRVAHVHTGKGFGPNQCCRKEMIENMKGYTSIKNFKPFDEERDGQWIDKEVYPVCYREGKGFHTFGVVTAQNEQYSIFTLANQKKPEKFKVLLVMRQTNQPNEFR